MHTSLSIASLLLLLTSIFLADAAPADTGSGSQSLGATSVTHCALDITSDHGGMYLLSEESYIEFDPQKPVDPSIKSDLQIGSNFITWGAHYVFRAGGAQIPFQIKSRSIAKIDIMTFHGGDGNQKDDGQGVINADIGSKSFRDDQKVPDSSYEHSNARLWYSISIEPTQDQVNDTSPVQPAGTDVSAS